MGGILGYPLVGVGVPPSRRYPRYRTTDRVLDTPRSVCLLRSLRRTFLLYLVSYFTNKCRQRSLWSFWVSDLIGNLNEVEMSPREVKLGGNNYLHLQTQVPNNLTNLTNSRYNFQDTIIVKRRFFVGINVWILILCLFSLLYHGCFISLMVVHLPLSIDLSFILTSSHNTLWEVR